MTFRIEQIDSNKLIVTRHHDRQNRGRRVTRANVGDDVDRLCLSWGHKKVDLEIDPVGSLARPGGEQRQR